MVFVVTALYHFFDFSHYAEMRAPLLSELEKASIKGSLLLAPEGINGTVAGARQATDRLLAYLKNEVVKSDFDYKQSFCATQPFGRAKVKLKKETIPLGEPAPLDKRGVYVSPREWNALLDDPETVVIDARNAYEVHLGSFVGARNPKTRSFRELPAYARRALDPRKHKKIATFCTGGIRCEKFTAWLGDQGFEHIYHLKGGILKYLEEIPPEHSKWQGECYVFDGRIAVGHGLVPSASVSHCRACGHPLTPADRAHARYKEGEACGFCPAV